MIPCRVSRTFILIPLTFVFASGCSRTGDQTVAEEESPLAPVKAVLAQLLPLDEKTELVGSTAPLPNQSARITAAVEGRILWMLKDGKDIALVEGQRVERGQVVVQLDDRIAQANVEKARANAAEAEEQKRQADVAEKLAQLDLNRLEKLRPNKSDDDLPLVSRIELDKARLVLQDAQSKQKGALAKQYAARAESQGLAAQLDYFKLRAPITGILGALQVVPGQTLAVGTSLAEIINLDEIDVVCAAGPNVARKLALGQPASLLSRSALEPKNEVAGKVVFIAAQAQAETGNFLIKVRFLNTNLQLRANTITRVRIVTQSEKKRLTIPEAALQEDQEPPLVIVAHAPEVKKTAAGHEEKVAKAKRLHAVLGVRDRDRHVVEILRLVDPESKKEVALQGQLFVIEGGHGLHDDDGLKVEQIAPDEKK